MNEIEQFRIERNKSINEMSEDSEVKDLSLKWMNEVGKHKYSYNFSWLGRPIIQLPTDMIAIQEIIWEIKPDLIIETGIAHGGSVIYYASLLELLGNDGEVVGIDIDIRKHNRIEIENHPLFKRITMIEGSSIESVTVKKVEKIARDKETVLVLLDSCHTHEHVLKELEIYGKYVSLDSYMVVFDTAVEFLSEEFNNDRPWGIGNNPWTAVQEYLSKNGNYTIDKSIQNKLLVTAAFDGYLKRIK